MCGERGNLFVNEKAPQYTGLLNVYFSSILSGISEIHFYPSAICYFHNPRIMNFDRNRKKKNGMVTMTRKRAKKGGPGKIKLSSWKNEITQLET